jgi:bla regulator protein blaR1
MMLYLLKFIGGSTLLWVVYHFGLEQEKMHRFKRFYLLFSLGFTLVVPLISLPWFAKESVDAPTELNAALVQGVQFTPQIAQPQAPSLPVESVLWVIYSVIAAILLLRLLYNLYQAMVMQAKGEKLQHAGVPLVILPENVPTHSFFSTIYINQKDFAEESATAILAHELAHVRQGHSWDILFVEVLRVLFWFNPVLYAYKRAIQLNHEFLADEAVIQQENFDIPTYQYLLLDKIAQAQQLSLVQQFDYFITKKRMIMMTKEAKRQRSFWKRLALLPLLTGLILLLSDKVQSQSQTSSPPKVLAQKEESGVSQALLDEYNAGVKRYWDTIEAIKGKKNPVIRLDNFKIDRLNEIYKMMSEAQRAEVKTIPRLVPKPPPPARKSPTNEQLQLWSSTEVYGVWIDGKKVANAVLKNLKASDFSMFFVSKLYKNAIPPGSIRRFQIDLYTHKGYEDAFIKNW